MRLSGFRFKARKHWGIASIKNLGQMYHQFTSLMPFGRPSLPLLQTRTLNTSGPSTIWSGLTQPQGLRFSSGECCPWRASLRRLQSWSPLRLRHRPPRRCVASLLTLRRLRLHLLQRHLRRQTSSKLRCMIGDFRSCVLLTLRPCEKWMFLPLFDYQPSRMSIGKDVVQRRTAPTCPACLV